MTNAHDHYLTALAELAIALDGGRRRVGTVVVAEPDRAGSRIASAYPLGDQTVVFADPDVVRVVSSLEQSEAISAEEYVRQAEGLGGELVGMGHQRVLDGPLRHPDASADDLSFRPLDTSDASDVRRLAGLIADCTDDDVEEADLDLDDLDPNVAALLGPDGRIVAYAGARPADFSDDFDDIAVLTRPDARRRGLGALVVHEFVRHRRDEDPSRLFLYRYTSTNVGSGRVAESVGFTLVHRIAAVRFPPPPST